MSLSTIFFAIVVLGAFFGAKRPWLGSVSGLIGFPLLYYLFCSSEIAFVFITAFAGAIVGGVAGLIASLFYSGFKGKAHSSGPSFMGGFGGGRGGAPPGGIILSDEERKRTRR
jgi:hypothetical protein